MKVCKNLLSQNILWSLNILNIYEYSCFSIPIISRIVGSLPNFIILYFNGSLNM